MPQSDVTPVRVFVVGDEERTVSMVLRQWGNEVDTIEQTVPLPLAGRRISPMRRRAAFSRPPDRTSR